MKFFKNVILLVIAFSFICLNVYAKKDKKKKDSDTATTLIDTTKTVAKDSIKKEGKPQFKTIKEVTEKCKKTAGLFPIYQDTTTGKTYIEISEDKFGNEFIYFATVIDGIIDAGFARGGYKDNSVFKFPEPFKINDLMNEFFEWLTNTHDIHPVLFAVEAHTRFVSIHPFTDGNGRTARLILNLLLFQFGF